MRHSRLWLLLCSVFVFALSYSAINTDAGSDPKFTLIVSQSILENGTATLDTYRGDTLLGESFEDHVRRGDILETVSGQSVSYFPLGPSLLSLPFVSVANVLSNDMRKTTDNFALQDLLAAATTVAIFLLAYALARIYVPPRDSLVIALVGVLGSSLISTLGTALWSHNFAVLTIAAALWLLARNAENSAAGLRPYLLGGLLALSFMVRPTAAALIVPTFLYLLVYRRQQLLSVAGTAALLFVLSLGISYLLLGDPWPSYFSTARLTADRVPVAVGVLGNLISPSRGILWFSPFLWLLALGLVIYWRKVSRSIVWLCLGWFALHLLLVARAASWWGGWSFGPRLLTDIWPGLILLTALLWQVVVATESRLTRKQTAVGFLVLGLVAMTIHLIQGLYSQPASLWNDFITPVPQGNQAGTLGDLFDWRKSQIVASNSMLCDIPADETAEWLAGDNLISHYEVGQLLDTDILPVRIPAGRSASAAQSPSSVPVSPTASSSYLPLVNSPSPAALLTGWSAYTEIEGQGFRWSVCPQADIVLRLETVPSANELALDVTGWTLAEQRVQVAINNQPIGEIQMLDERTAPQTQTLRFPARLLKGAANIFLQFHFPDAHYPGWDHQRPLGMALQSLRIYEPGAPIPQQPALPGNYPAP